MPVTPWRQLQSNPFSSLRDQSPITLSFKASSTWSVCRAAKLRPFLVFPWSLPVRRFFTTTPEAMWLFVNFRTWWSNDVAVGDSKIDFDGFLRRCRPWASFSSCSSHEHQPKMQFPVFSEERMPVCFLWFRFWKKWPIFSITSFISSFNFQICVFLLTRFASNLSFTAKEPRVMEECYCPWNYRNLKKLHFGKWRLGACVPLCSFPKTEHCPPSVPQCWENNVKPQNLFNTHFVSNNFVFVISFIIRELFE